MVHGSLNMTSEDRYFKAWFTAPPWCLNYPKTKRMLLCPKKAERPLGIRLIVALTSSLEPVIS